MTSASHPPRLDDARRLFLAGDLPAAHAVAHALIDTRSPWQAVQIDAAMLLARGKRRLSEFDDALRLSAEAIAAAKAIGDRRRECLAHGIRSHVLTSVGESDLALVESYAALKLADQLRDVSAQAAAHEALGDVHWAMQQWDAGVLAYGRALHLAQSCADIETGALAHAGLGAMAHGQGLDAASAGQASEARACQRRSAWHAAEFIRLAEQLGDVHNAAQGRHNEAVALMELGDWATARTRFEAFLAGLTDGPSDQRAIVLKNLADIDILEDSLGAGIARMQQALAMTDALNLPIYAIDCCRELADVCERIGDLAAALRYQKRFHALYVQLASESAQTHASEMAVAYETDQVRADAVAERARADRLEGRQVELSVEAERLMRASLEDALTGIPNRRRFDQVLRDELPARSARENYSLALLDIDLFKRVNDRFSHAVGDEVLRRVGAVLAQNCRRGDLAARYGGEEFVLVLAGLDANEALLACERLRRAIEQIAWATVHPGLVELTVSIGLAHRGEPGAPPTPDELLALADRRLYLAKDAGRNRVVAFTAVC